MLVRQFHYLVVLASERHFGRAAALCNISQPSLSASMRQLEEELGVPIIRRGHRYIGLTPEGEQVLERAKRILSETETMRQELRGLKRGLSGKLRLGVIPTALTLVPEIVTGLTNSHPEITFQISSMTSNEIQQGIDNFTLEAGITYLDNEPLERVRAKPMHEQTFAVLTRIDSPLAKRKFITWQEAAELQLCLLTPDMQNRRIIDGVFRTLGCQPKPLIETNSILILCSHATVQGMASIVPSQFLQSYILPPDTIYLPLTSPHVTRTIGLIISDRNPPLPLAQIIFGKN